LSETVDSTGLRLRPVEGRLIDIKMAKSLFF
jgi:hypothetical protein